jgi:hypothetical protein
LANFANVMNLANLSISVNLTSKVLEISCCTFQLFMA